MEFILNELKLSKDRNDNLLAEMFLELPSQQDYPEYYELIDDPISITEIQNKLNNINYSLPQFYKDINVYYISFAVDGR
jgi:hypothetical protein